MTAKVTCFLPCREGSQRVPRKNITPFAGYGMGLVELKLTQLDQATEIDEVVLSTNDEAILDYAATLNMAKLRVHSREAGLASSATSTDALVAHALALIPDGDILWTHVTSPFVSARHYNDIVRCYREKSAAGYDSLMTVTELHSFLWQDGQPLNYDRQQEKWPRTQTLSPVHEINSGAFLAPSDIYRSLGDRIGERPYMHVLDRFVGHDIDWPDDFTLAECMVEKELVTL